MEKKIAVFIAFLMISTVGVQHCQGQKLKTDSVYLPLYAPSENGTVFLNKVLDSEHQWLDMDIHF